MDDDNSKDAIIRGRVLRGTISNSVGQFVTLGAGFLLTPFILHQLGATQYGLWALVGSIIAYGTLLDLGISNAVVKYVAEYRARQEPEEARSVIATALAVYTVLGMILFGLSLAIAGLIPDLFGISDENRTTAIWLIVIVGLGAGISLPCSTAISVLRGLHRYDLVNAISVIGILLVSGATVAVLLLGAGILGMAAVNIPVMIFTQILGIWFIRRQAPELRFGWSGASRKGAGRVFAFSSSVALFQLGGQLSDKSDQIVIGAFLPVGAITPYALALRIGTISHLLTQQFIKVLLPLASELDAERDLTRLRALSLTSTRLTLAIFLSIACVVVLLAGPILALWVGAQYAAYAHLVAILTVAGLFDVVIWPAGIVLQGMARHRLLALLSLAGGILNLVLSVILVQRYGITGVAVGTLIPMVLVCCVVMPHLMHTLGISATMLMNQILLPAFVPAIPSAGTLVVLRGVFDPSSVFGLLVVGGAGALVYATSYLLIGASQFERDTYRGYFVGGVSLVGALIRREAQRLGIRG